MSIYNKINTLPCEIIGYWVNKENSKVCKLWRTIWCMKPIAIVSSNQRNQCPLTIVLIFENIWRLDLRIIPINFPIKKLTTLKVLSIYDNSISNRSFGCLTNITKLNLIRNKRINSFKNLTNLTSLNLFKDKIITDKVLKKISNISELTLHETAITDSSLIYHTNIKRLTLLESPSVTDKSIKKLINLEYINFCSTNITFRSLKHLTNLTKMKSDMKINKRLTRLKSLSVS